MAVSSSSALFLCQNAAVYKPHHHHHRKPAVVSATAATAAGGARLGSVGVMLPQPPSSSFYEVLGIRAGATCQEIKSAYRRLARTVHPDVSEACDANAREFMRIHEAYTTLSDPEKRADYDRMIFGSRFKVVAYPTVVGRSSVSGYARRRTWETDQCW